MILGSSAFSMIITLVFNWAQNRKNDSLSYITEERKVWREKIREISSKIEQYTYQEKDKMGQELVQLQMNINPYGKASATDCIHDGHIWSVIQQIKNSQNSKEFEENKQLLLDYLALMLKDDWERSKEEVRGYSKLAVYMVIVGILFALYAILYFYIFKLENYTWFLLVVLINILVLVLTKYYFVDKVKKIYKDRNSLAIKKVLKKKKWIRKCAYYML